MKKILLTLITSLFIAGSLIAIKNIYSCDIPIHNRGIKDCIAQGNLDLLLIGSSTFRSNLDINLLDENYDDNTYIISYGGNQYVATSIQYNEIKNRSAYTYDTYVFELDPLMLTEEVKLSDSRVIWDLSLDGKLKLWNKMKASGNTDSSIMYEYFITSGMDDLITYPITERIYSTRYYKGAKTDDIISPGKEILDNTEYDISDLKIIDAQLNAVKEIIEKCKNDNQKFIFIESPHYYILENDPVYKKYNETFINLLNEENVNYILSKDVGFDNTNADYFEDMSHMSSKGRKEYTKKLINLLKK